MFCQVLTWKIAQSLTASGSSEDLLHVASGPVLLLLACMSSVAVLAATWPPYLCLLLLVSLCPGPPYAVLVLWICSVLFSPELSTQSGVQKHLPHLVMP